MHVRDILTAQVVTVEPKASLAEIKALMDKHRFHHVLAVRDASARPDSQELVGVISDRDVLRRSSPFLGTDAEREVDRELLYPASRFMSTQLITVTPDTTIRIAGELLLKERISCLPVIDPQRHVRGIATWRDILRWMTVQLNQNEQRVMQERRTYVRVVPTQGRKVEVQLMGDGILEVLEARDVSVGGFSAYVGHSFDSAALQTEIDLVVKLPDTPPFSAKGRVRHRAGFGTIGLYGVEFTQVNDRDRARIEAYIAAAKQKNRRRKQRAFFVYGATTAVHRGGLDRKPSAGEAIPIYSVRQSR